MESNAPTWAISNGDAAKIIPQEKRNNMSLADKIFVTMCKDILENGTSTEGEKVRPTGRTAATPIPSKNSAW